MGRRRTLQAVMIASSSLSPCSRNWPVNSTIRMLSDTTMPVIISTPIGLMMFMVVPVNKQEENHARDAGWDG